MRPGPKKGYKQTPEHIAKRKRFGSEHHQWLGDAITVRSGRSRAKRAYPTIGPCVKCGKVKSERHHKDGNTANNRASNIIPLCRKCHMRTDGRLEAIRIIAKQQQPKAAAARSAMPKPTNCPKGHLYVKANKRGSGVCYVCLNDYKRNKRRMDKQNTAGTSSQTILC